MDPNPFHRNHSQHNPETKRLYRLFKRIVGIFYWPFRGFNPGHNAKTELLIQALQHTVTGQPSLKDLATDYFQDDENKLNLVHDIFAKAPPAPPTLEEQKEGGLLDHHPFGNGLTIGNLISRLLADNEVDVYAKDSTGWPVLFFAVENYAVLQMLFENRPELRENFTNITAREKNKPNAIPWNAFTWADSKKEIKSLVFLVNQLPQPAATAKKIEIIRRFLTKDLTQPSNQDNFLYVLNAFALPAGEMNIFLFEAVNANAPLAIQTLLKAPNIDVNANNHYGATPLIEAARNGHAEAIPALLAAPGIDVNINTSWFGQTPLMWAVREGHTAAITRLLENPGTNVNAVDDFGMTALMLAAFRGKAGALAALLAAPDIDVNTVNDDNLTALMLAAFRGHAAIISALLAAPGITLTLHNQGREALALAERYHHRECSQLMRIFLAERLPQLEVPLPTQSSNINILGNSLLIGIAIYFWGEAILTSSLGQWLVVPVIIIAAGAHVYTRARVNGNAAAAASAANQAPLEANAASLRFRPSAVNSDAAAVNGLQDIPALPHSPRPS